jgi:hypothetical protein
MQILSSMESHGRNAIFGFFRKSPFFKHLSDPHSNSEWFTSPVSFCRMSRQLCPENSNIIFDRVSGPKPDIRIPLEDVKIGKSLLRKVVLRWRVGLALTGFGNFEIMCCSIESSIMVVEHEMSRHSSWFDRTQRDVTFHVPGQACEHDEMYFLRIIYWHWETPTTKSCTFGTFQRWVFETSMSCRDQWSFITVTKDAAPRLFTESWLKQTGGRLHERLCEILGLWIYPRPKRPY